MTRAKSNPRKRRLSPNPKWEWPYDVSHRLFVAFLHNIAQTAGKASEAVLKDNDYEAAVSYCYKIQADLISLFPPESKIRRLIEPVWDKVGK
jgi:hypothetical protein